MDGQRLAATAQPEHFDEQPKAGSMIRMRVGEEEAFNRIKRYVELLKLANRIRAAVNQNGGLPAAQRQHGWLATAVGEGRASPEQ